MTSSLPVRACRYLIYVVRRWSQYAIYFIRRFVVYIARYVAWQWSWLTMNPTLQDVVAERNAAIRLAMEAQTTVHRLREQVSQLENIATSELNRAGALQTIARIITTTKLARHRPKNQRRRLLRLLEIPAVGKGCGHTQAAKTRDRVAP